MNAITSYQFSGAPFSFHVGALPLAFEALLDRFLHIGVRPIGVIIGARWSLLAEGPRRRHFGVVLPQRSFRGAEVARSWFALVPTLGAAVGLLADQGGAQAPLEVLTNLIGRRIARPLGHLLVPSLEFFGPPLGLQVFLAPLDPAKLAVEGTSELTRPVARKALLQVAWRIGLLVIDKVYCVQNPLGTHKTILANLANIGQYAFSA